MCWLLRIANCSFPRMWFRSCVTAARSVNIQSKLLGSHSITPQAMTSPSFLLNLLGARPLLLNRFPLIQQTAAAARLIREQLKASAERCSLDAIVLEAMHHERAKCDILQWLDAMASHAQLGLNHLQTVKKCQSLQLGSSRHSGMHGANAYNMRSLIRPILLSDLPTRDPQLKEAVQLAGEMVGFELGWLDKAGSPSLSSTAALRRHRFILDAGLDILARELFKGWVDGGQYSATFKKSRGGPRWARSDSSQN